MAAATYNFIINQGETFTRNFVWADATPTPYNLTGWTARIQGRATQGSTATTFDSNGGGTPTGISISISAALGKVTVTMTPACTSAIPCSGVYALELTETATGRVKRLVEGQYQISAEINR